MAGQGGLRRRDFRGSAGAWVVADGSVVLAHMRYASGLLFFFLCKTEKEWSRMVLERGHGGGAYSGCSGLS